MDKIENLKNKIKKLKEQNEKLLLQWAEQEGIAQGEAPREEFIEKVRAEFKKNAAAV